MLMRNSGNCWMISKGSQTRSWPLFVPASLTIPCMQFLRIRNLSVGLDSRNTN